MSRATPEWIGKNDDSRVPIHVRLRIFDRHGGVCYLSGRRIRAGERWDLDHVLALCNGGRHCESNLRPVLVLPHRTKTAEDVKEKSITNRKRSKHLGIVKKKRTIGGRRFNGDPILPKWK